MSKITAVFLTVLTIVCAPKTIALAQSAALQPIQTGKFKTAFDERSDLAAYPTVIRRILGDEAGDLVDQQLSAPGAPQHSVLPAEETFDVFVPETYDGTKPFGLFVYISPRETGGPPREFFRGLEKLEFLFVGANKAGNKHDVPLRRIPLALHAVHNMTAGHNIDTERIYVGGISGGGKVAGFLGVSYGDVFRGAMHIVGSGPIGDGKILMPKGELGQTVRTRNRYVFVTGENDFNRAEVRKHYRNFGEQGFENTALFDITGMGHTVPSRRNFIKALRALDGKK